MVNQLPKIGIIYTYIKGKGSTEIETADKQHGEPQQTYRIAKENNKLLHYENMTMQYTAIFHGCKNNNFQLKYFDFFHIFAQNIYCGNTLEPPH